MVASERSSSTGFAASAFMMGIVFSAGPVANADLKSLLACLTEGTKMVASCCIDEGGAYLFTPSKHPHVHFAAGCSNEAPTTVTMPVPTVLKVSPPSLENPNHPKPGATVPVVPAVPRS
ncbi:MAG: hypothetical protein ACXWZ2_01500 [Mycobacterium sp.]